MMAMAKKLTLFSLREHAMPVAVDPQSQSAEPGFGLSRAPSRRGFLAWSVAASGLLVGGGTLRVAGSASKRPEELSVLPPFPLATIPRSLDGWVSLGNETQLDPITTRITGSTDVITRIYQEELTGTALSVLVLYGPAEPVLPHTPQVCYPASGYRSVIDAVDRTIRIDDQLNAVFRTGLFSKSGGRSVLQQLVYHSYRLDGVWSPSVSDRSLPRRRAGLFKVQIQRRVHDGERMDGEEPIEAFLRQLVPTVERMVAATTTSSASSADSVNPAGSRPG